MACDDDECTDGTYRGRRCLLTYCLYDVKGLDVVF